MQGGERRFPEAASGLVVNTLEREVVVGMGASIGRENAPKLMGGASASILAGWAGLTPAQPTYQTSTSIPAGLVLSTDPVAGQQWPTNKPVTVVVSSGQPLPDLTAADMEAAVRTIAGTARSMGVDVEGL